MCGPVRVSHLRGSCRSADHRPPRPADPVARWFGLPRRTYCERATALCAHDSRPAGDAGAVLGVFVGCGRTCRVLGPAAAPASAGSPGGSHDCTSWPGWGQRRCWRVWLGPTSMWRSRASRCMACRLVPGTTGRGLCCSRCSSCRRCIARASGRELPGVLWPPVQEVGARAVFPRRATLDTAP